MATGDARRRTSDGSAAVSRFSDSEDEVLRLSCSAGLIGIGRVSGRVKSPDPIAVGDAGRKARISIRCSVSSYGSNLRKCSSSAGFSFDFKTGLVARVIRPSRS